MHFELKRLSPEAVSASLAKANQYRLLQQPSLAESICLDILEVDPTNKEALIALILALTDQFIEHGFTVSDTRIEDVITRLGNPYLTLYYRGLVCERRAEATLHQRVPGYVAYEWLREAMHWYEKAEEARPEGNDDALLRWNTCARILMNNDTLRPRLDDGGLAYLE